MAGKDPKDDGADKGRRDFFRKAGLLLGGAALATLPGCGAYEDDIKKAEQAKKDAQENTVFKKELERLRANAQLEQEHQAQHQQLFNQGIFPLLEEGARAVYYKTIPGISPTHKLMFYKLKPEATPDGKPRPPFKPTRENFFEGMTLKELGAYDALPATPPPPPRNLTNLGTFSNEPIDNRLDYDREKSLNIFYDKMTREQRALYDSTALEERTTFNTVLLTRSTLNDEQKILYAELRCLFDKTRDPSKIWGNEHAAVAAAKRENTRLWGKFIEKVKEIDQLDNATKTAVFGRFLYHAAKAGIDVGIRGAGDVMGYSHAIKGVSIAAKDIRFICTPQQSGNHSNLPTFMDVVKHNIVIGDGFRDITAWGSDVQKLRDYTTRAARASQR